MAFASTQSHTTGRQALAEAWPLVTGRKATLPELQIAGAQAAFEGGYGLAPYTNKLTGETRVLNNLGAIQGSPNVAPCAPGDFEATDTHADGTPYQGCYRQWPSLAAAVGPFIKQITLRRPTAWAFMQRGDVDGYAQALRSRDPQTGVLGYFEATAEHYAGALAPRAAEIATVLGEPLMARRGGPVLDAVELGELDGIPWRVPALVGVVIGVVVTGVRWWWGRA